MRERRRSGTSVHRPRGRVQGVGPVGPTPWTRGRPIAAAVSPAAALGAGSGATFALVALLTPANQVGSVTGVVGAAGGLGGFLPPLVMGSLYGAYESYAIGLVLLAIVAAAALGFTLTAVRAAAEGGERKPGTGRQRGHGTTAGTTA